MKLGFRSIVSCVAVLALAGLSACGSGSNKLVGKWDGDIKAMMLSQMPAGAEPPPGMDAMLKDAYMTVEFNADGTSNMAMKMMGNEKKDTGKWELLSQEGDTYKLKLTSKNEKGEEKTENATVVFEGNDSAKMTMDGKEGPAMLLKRKS